jgi:hypothetical protein
MDWGQWFKHYIWNLDTIIAIVIFTVVLYFIFTSKRKTYKFQGLDNDFSSRLKKGSSRKTKKKRKLNKHEEECRRIFQDLFGQKFKSVRPDWLKNPATKKNLEIDGFNPDIKTHLGMGLGFEYDGEQHSKFTPHFHRSGPDEFVYQVKKDDWKDMKCKERGVLLIRIPHFVAFHDLRRYIKTELDRQKISIPNISINSSNMYNF